MIRRLQRSNLSPRMTALGMLLAWGIIWVGALHFSPTAHGHIHGDAQDQDHHCAVEIFADGVLMDAIDLQVEFTAVVVATESREPTELWVEEDEHLRPLGRAPPLG